jgi:hypothetical protein
MRVLGVLALKRRVFIGPMAIALNNFAFWKVA